MLIRPGDRWIATEGGAPDAAGFRFERFFDGPVEGWGVFQDRFGTVRKRFASRMRGRWDGDVFELEERFAYADGSADHRVWRVTMPGPDIYRAEAPDLVGHAEGRASEEGVNFRYALRVPVGARRMVFDFDDWMVPHASGVLNVSCARKFGFVVGRLTAFFWRPGDGPTSR